MRSPDCVECEASKEGLPMSNSSSSSRAHKGGARYTHRHFWTTDMIPSRTECKDANENRKVFESGTNQLRRPSRAPTDPNVENTHRPRVEGARIARPDHQRNDLAVALSEDRKAIATARIVRRRVTGYLHDGDDLLAQIWKHSRNLTLNFPNFRVRPTRLYLTNKGNTRRGSPYSPKGKRTLAEIRSQPQQKSR